MFSYMLFLLAATTVWVVSPLGYTISWRQRMHSYSELAKCQHIATTSPDHSTFQALDENIEESGKYTFYTLNSNEIKFRLSTSPVPNSRHPEYFNFDVMANATTVNCADKEQQSEVAFDFFSDQPNQVSIHFKEGGGTDVLINGVAVFTHLDMVKAHPRFISFASNQEQQLEEFFFNCN